MRLLLAILLPAYLAAQPPVAETVRVEGRVLSSEGKPLEGVQVRARSLQAPVKEMSAATNQDGLFAFDLAIGDQSILVYKGGYTVKIVGMTLTAGQQLAPLLFRLAPTGTISGRVLDRDGNPIRGAMVTPLRYAYTRGARSLTAAGPSAPVNALGEYRFSDLLPGRYYVRVEPLAPAVTTYYPSVLDPFAAASIDVEIGVDRTGIDIRPLIEPVFHIRGKAVDPSGAPAVDAQLRILPEPPIEFRGSIGALSTTADGSFEFKDLLPGRYIIRATPVGTFPWAARMEVAIGREDIDGLMLRVDQGFVLAGTVAMEDGVKLPPMKVSLRDAEQLVGYANLDAAVNLETGVFRFERVQPGKFYLQMSGPPGNVYVKSVQASGLDVTRLPLDMTFGGLDNVRIVLGSKPGEVRVSTKPRASVALWPDIRNSGDSTSGVRVVAANDEGVARFPNLRPEKYYAAAFEGVEDAFVRSPEFLDRMRSRSTAITLENGAVIGHTLTPVTATEAAAVISLIP